MRKARPPLAFFCLGHSQRRYEIKEVIGKGSYGVVCAAVDTVTKERVAIKKIQVRGAQATAALATGHRE